jgi:glyoxylase-like metal-dependent hydrolase (beta-lactamase superfamily II)
LHEGHALREQVAMSPMLTEKPIASVHVLSTGSGGQHKEHRYGSRLPQLWWVLTSRSWIEIPINVYVLEHRDGLVLFDAGLDPAMATDPDYVSSAIGRFLLHRIFQLHIGPDDSLDKKLEGLGYAAADIRKVVISHLHFDHIGGIAAVPQMDIARAYRTAGRQMAADRIRAQRRSVVRALRRLLRRDGGRIDDLAAHARPHGGVHVDAVAHRRVAARSACGRSDL